MQGLDGTALISAIQGMIVEVLPENLGGLPPSMSDGIVEQLWWSPFHDQYFSAFKGDQSDLRPVSRQHAKIRWPESDLDDLASTGVVYFDGSGSNQEAEMTVADWRSDDPKLMAVVCTALGLRPGSSAHRRFLGPDEGLAISSYLDEDLGLLMGTHGRMMTIQTMGDSAWDSWEVAEVIEPGRTTAFATNRLGERTHVMLRVASDRSAAAHSYQSFSTFLSWPSQKQLSALRGLVAELVFEHEGQGGGFDKESGNDVDGMEGDAIVIDDSDEEAGGEVRSVSLPPTLPPSVSGDGRPQIWWSPFANQFYTATAIKGQSSPLKPISAEEAQALRPDSPLGEHLVTGERSSS